MATATEYSPRELLICIAAKQMEDNTSAFIGTGIPMLAAALAKKTHAPNLTSIFEFGGVASLLQILPLAVGGSRSFHKALVASSICDIMETAQRGLVEYGFLGGAQIDMYGNLNSTAIGEHKSPKVRFPGSGGANDVASSCWRTIAIMTHDAKKFVPKIDFVTTAGYLTGKGAREEAGLAKGTGPYRVVSNLALLGYDDETKRMKLLKTNPGITVDDVVKNTGFELIIPDEVPENEPPTEGELKILREDIDPNGLYR